MGVRFLDQPGAPAGKVRFLDEAPKKGLIRQGWDALGKPEQLSSQGLEKMASFIPEGKVTGNLPADLARGTPRILANSVAKAAPGFVSRGAILTAGAMPALRGLGKVAEVIGPGIAGQLESLSGMKPGLLGKAFKDPTLIFSRIPQGARDAYQASSEMAQKVSPEVAGTPRPLPLVMKLLQKAKQGMIGQDEALAGRQAIDQLWESKSITANFKNMARGVFDSIAKTATDIREADTTFARGKQAAGLRQLLPQNKFGGTSAFKTAIMAALREMGPLGKVGMATLSPAAMGTGATALGAAAKVASPFVKSPRLAVSAQQLIHALLRSRNQSASPRIAE